MQQFESHDLFSHQGGPPHVTLLTSPIWRTKSYIPAGPTTNAPTHHVAMPMAFPETSMSDAVDVDPRLWMNAGYDSVADMNTLDLQRFAPIPREVHHIGGNIWQQQSPPCANTQAAIASRYGSGANAGSAALTALGRTGDTISDNRSMTISWQRTDGAWAQAHVLVTDQIRDAMMQLWPTCLRLEILDIGVCTVDIQTWIHKNHAPVVRIKSVPGTDFGDFDELVKSLRNRGGCAIARWKIGGNRQMQLLFTPLCKDLFCAAFPTKGPGTAKLPPMPRSREPDRKKCHVVPSSWEWPRPSPLPSPVVMPSSPKRPPTGNAAPEPQPWIQPPAYYPSESPGTMEPRGNPNLFVPWDHASAPALVPIHPKSPPHPQVGLGPQAYTQELLQLSQAQQILEAAPQNMFVVGNKPDSWWTGTDAARCMAMADPFNRSGSDIPIGGHSAPWFGIGEDDTGHPGTASIFWDADPTASVSFARSLRSNDKGDGAMNGLGMEAISNPSADLGVWGYSGP